MISHPRSLRRRSLALAALIVASISGSQAQPAAPAPSGPPPPPPPQEPPSPYIPPEMFALPDDLEVTVFALTPQFRNPSNMDIDSKGRIWLTEAYNYRRHAGKDPAGDRVMVLTDTDGDGKADQSHVFVQEPVLLAPLGIAVIDNKIVVSCAPDLIVYTDVDRDAKFDPRVDKREVLLSGFDGRNHDHSLHSVTQGPDGKWYFNHGNAGGMFTDRSGRTFRNGSVYNPTKSGSGSSVYGATPPDYAGAKSDDGHVYVGGTAMRMNPDGTNVEPIGFNFRNSYEQAVTSFGDVFQNDNDDPPGARTSYLMEYGNAGFFAKDGKRTWQADRRPGQTTAIAEWRQHDPGTIPVGDVYGNGAPTGMVMYEGDQLGAKWRGLLLSCETSRNVVFGYFPKPEGAGFALERFKFFTSNKEEDFAGIDSQRGRLRSDDLKTWFRPSDVAIGPDGAVYIADWFDPRTGGHSALDSSFAGAIYRVAPKGKKLVTPKIDFDSTSGQIMALKSPAIHVRAVAFDKLRAQRAAAVNPVSALLDDANPFVRGRAVFLLSQLGPQGVAKVEATLKHADPMMRVAAFRAMRRINHKVLEHAKSLASDSSPIVRRDVALAMRDVQFDGARDILLTLAKGYDGKDRSYLEAWGIGATGKEAQVYGALAATAPAADAAKWPASYANLIWRLTPKGAEKAFAARALATALPESDRLMAVTALGFTPSREASNALLDLAQKSNGMVKTHAVWWLLNYKDLRWQEYGVDAALKTRGIYDPSKITVSPSVVPEPEAAKYTTADVIALTGDVKRGAEKAQACLLCHRIGNQGNEYGPGLNGFARAQATEVVINSIVNPSAEIAHGFDGFEVTLRDGGKVHGLVLSASDPVIVQSMGGLTQTIPANKTRGKHQPLGRSLMLSADQLGLSAQDVADVVAYLKTQ